MMRCMFAVVLCGAAFLFACDTVDSPHPVGEPLPADSEVDLTGTWATERDGLVMIRQGEAGELRVAGVEWQGEDPQLHVLSARVTTDEDAYYLNLIPPAAEGDERYSFHRLLLTDGHMILLEPNVDHFRRAVEQGELAGEIVQEKYSVLVRLDITREALSAFISPTAVGEQFRLDRPIVLRRVSEADAEPGMRNREEAHD